MSETKIFKPKKSNGGKYLLLTTIAISILLIVITIPIYQHIHSLFFYTILISIFTAVVIIFALLVYAYYEMEYIVTENYLLIKWGLKTTRIQLKTITSVIRPPNKNYQGIRLGGVGIPGYLFGKFKYLIEGNFKTVSLYATKIDNLLFIETNGRKEKFYGITPANEEDFISLLNSKLGDLGSVVKEKPESSKNVKHPSRDLKFALSLFIISIILSVFGLIYFLIFYLQLPQIVPLHFNINFVPDRYGNKIDLLWLISTFIIFGIGLSSLLYYYIHRRTHLDQTKYGYSIMLLPIAINVLFLIITIIFLNEIMVLV
ncbi:MAG: PH domain-containing protein [Candidatus Lokiarchaeota archaeon]